jgi:hypothetical protein
MTKKKTDGPALDPNVTRTREQNRAALRRKVEMFYDLQRLRIQSAGRTYERADGTSIQLHEIDVAILERRSKDLETAERAALRDVQDHLDTMPFYRDVLSDKVRYRGIGPTMAGVILSSFAIERQDTVSKMWAFAGLRPLPAHRCRTCHSVVETDGDGSFVHLKERVRTPTPPKPGEVVEAKLPKCNRIGSLMGLIDVYESGKAQRPVKGEKLTYNSFLRTKLVGVLAPVLLKCASPWKKHYSEYKHRKATAGWGRNDGHRHQAAMRYMIKMLLLDIHKEWRTAENLPVRLSYHEEKQGGHAAARGAEPMPAPPAEEPLSPEVAAELEYLNEAQVAS